MALEPVAKERFMEKLRLLSMSEKDDPYASSNEMKFGQHGSVACRGVRAYILLFY